MREASQWAGLPVNRQITKKLTVDRLNRNIFTVNRQMDKPILDSNVSDSLN